MASVCRGEAATAAGQDKPTPVDAEMMQPNLPFFVILIIFRVYSTVFQKSIVLIALIIDIEVNKVWCVSML